MEREFFSNLSDCLSSEMSFDEDVELAASAAKCKDIWMWEEGEEGLVNWFG